MRIVEIPVKTVSLANMREHWAARSKRAKTHRDLARMQCWAATADVPLPVVVTLTRVAPSNGLDDDNLRPALKSIRDGIADAYGIDDRDERIEWEYKQARGKYAVIVEVKSR